MARRNGIGASVFIDGEKEFKQAITSINKSVTALKTQLQATSTSFGKNNQSIEAYTSKNQDAKKIVEELQKRLETQNKALQSATEEFGEGSDKALEWQASVNRTQAEINKFTNEIESNEKAIEDLSNEMDNAGNETEQLQSTVSEAGDEFNRFDGRIDAVTIALGNLLAEGIKKTVSELKNLIKDSAAASIEFESAITTVRKVTTGTEEELQKLADEIRVLSLEIPVTTSELSELAAAGGRLGVHATDVMEFAETVGHLGNVSDFAGDAAATMMARFENVTNMGQDKFSNLGSTIVALGNNSAATENEIMSLGMNIAAAGSQVNMSEGDILGFAAALSSVGLEAAGGGTAFSRMLVDIQLATEVGGDKLGEFAKVAGMSAQEFKRAFQEDAASAMIAFIGGLANAEEQGISTIAMLDELGVNQVQMRDTFLRAANASEMLVESVDRGNQAFEKNTELLYVANQRYATTESNMQIAKNAADNLKISFGDGLNPVINTVAKDFADWAKRDDTQNMLEGIGASAGNVARAFLSAAKVVISNARLIATAVTGLTVAYKYKSAQMLIASGETAKLSLLQKGLVASTAAVTKAKAVATGQIKLKTAATAAMNKTMALTPMGKLTLATTALVGGVMLLKSAFNDATMETQRLNIELADNKAKIDEVVEASKSKAEAVVNEIGLLSRQKEQLDSIVDADGRVMEGFEARASFLVGELAEATGLEIELVEGQIKGYSELSEEIDNTIAKKRALAIVEVYQEDLIELLELQKDAYGNLADAQEELALLSTDSAFENWLDYHRKQRDSVVDTEMSVRELREEYDRLVLAEPLRKVHDATSNLEEVTGQIVAIEQISQDVADGIYDSATRGLESTVALMSGTADAQKETLESVNKDLRNGIRTNLNLRDDWNADVVDATVKTNRQLLAENELSLLKLNNAVWENTPEFARVYSEMAEMGADAFDDHGNLKPAVRRKIETAKEEALGNMGAYARVLQEMADAGEAAFDENGSLTLAATNKILEAQQSVGQYSPRVLAELKKLAEDGENVFDSNFDLSPAAIKKLQQLGLAVNDKIPEFEATMDRLAVGGGDSFASNRSFFFSAGEGVVEGIDSGVRHRSGALNSTMDKLGSSMISSLKARLESNSPSRAFARLGKGTVDGFVSGVENNAHKANDAIAELATSSLKSYDTAVAQHPINTMRNMDANINVIHNVRDTTQTKKEDPLRYVEMLVNRIVNKLDGAKVQMDKREFGKLVLGVKK